MPRRIEHRLVTHIAERLPEEDESLATSLLAGI
jgi:hypothetical protein